jgi:hypothetical protein
MYYLQTVLMKFQLSMYKTYVQGLATVRMTLICKYTIQMTNTLVGKQNLKGQHCYYQVSSLNMLCSPVVHTTHFPTSQPPIFSFIQVGFSKPFTTKFSYAFLFFQILATFPACHSLLVFIVLRMLGGNIYKH